MKECLVCGKTDSQKPQIYKGEDHCCDKHRKILCGELPWPEK